MIPDSIKAQAASWLARLQAEDRSPSDIAAWQAWVEADPRHRQAFAEATELWELGGAVRLDVREHETLVRRRAVLAGLVVAVTGATAGGGLWWRGRPRRYETAVGEQRTVRIADGSSLMLDTRTSLTVAIDDKRRLVELLAGRAFFQVRTDPLRPFVVKAAGHQMVAMGTAFDVTRHSEKVSVVMLDGQLALAPAKATDSSSPAIYLKTGERAVMDGGQAVIEEADLKHLTAWHKGRLIFESQPLSEAVAEMNRYCTIPIVIESDALGAIRIHGVYRTNDPEAFARSVALLVGGRVERRRGQITLLEGETAHRREVS